MNDDTSELTESADRPRKAICPTHTTEQKLIRRLDFRLVPCLIILYFLSFLDR